MVAGGYCHNNPTADCQQLRLSSTVFYDVAAGTATRTADKLPADIGRASKCQSPKNCKIMPCVDTLAESQWALHLVILIVGFLTRTPTTNKVV
jgi:hypothetical protein